jgi:ABC-type glycerol-3-phosphate transport system permease component
MTQSTFGQTGQQVQDDALAARKWRMQRQLRRGIVWILLLGGTIITIMPFLWMALTSLKTKRQIFTYPPEWIPDPVMWGNYRSALEAFPFDLYVRNTLIITGLNVIGTLLTASLAAYAFARLRFPGRDAIFMVLLSTLMLPYAVIMIPRYVEFRYLGWIDSWLPLIVPTWFGGSAFFIFLLRQFFRTIPRELSDSARVDGASEVRIYWQIVMPLARPALAVVAIFTFLDNWNDFLGPLIYLSSPDKFTVALGLASFKGLYSTQWEYLMAASTVMTIPTVVLFFAAQRYFVRGIVLTGMKG